MKLINKDRLVLTASFFAVLLTFVIIARPVISFAQAAGGSSTPKASSTATPTPTIASEVTPTPTRTPIPTAKATPRPTPNPTSTPLATAIPTATPTSVPTATPVPVCSTSAVNLVQNPSFESVTGSGPTWNIIETATTKVPYWTRADSSALVHKPMVVGSGTYSSITATAHTGSKYALVAALSDNQIQGPVGTLSAITNVGSTYVVSAWVAATEDTPNPNFILRLKNSSTGAESAPVVQVSIAKSTPIGWALISGAITTTASYDQVVVRYQNVYGVGWGLIDDVNVCKVTPLPWWKNPALLTGIVVVLAVLIGGITFGRTWKKRGHNYKGTVTLVK